MCKYLFFKKPFINVGTNEENIHENFVCFIWGGAGPLHQLRNTAPEPPFFGWCSSKGAAPAPVQQHLYKFGPNTEKIVGPVQRINNFK